jgi:hypothetical protein
MLGCSVRKLTPYPQPTLKIINNKTGVKMKLDLNGTELTQPIDDALIARSLQALNGDDDSFLVLSKDEMSYIQTCRESDGHYVLEYQEGSLAEHYECADEMLNFQKVSMVFTSYLNGTDEWKTALRWEPLESSSASDGAARPVKLLVLVVVVAIIAFTFLIVSL